MHRQAPQRGSHAKIVKTCDKTGGICIRIGGTFEQTVRICGKTREPFVMTGNNCSVTNILERAPANSNRTSRMSVTTVETSKEIATIFGQIDGTCIRIGRT